MGSDVYNFSIDCKKLLDRACDIIGFDIKDLVLHGLKDDYSGADMLEPAIFVTSAMYYEKYKALNGGFDVVAGHSLGEYCALYAAGVLDFDTAFRLVCKRGKIINESNVTGKMYALMGLERYQVESAINDSKSKVFISNINSRHQIVISGANDDVNNFLEYLCEYYSETTLRLISDRYPFHSPLMHEIEVKMACEIDKISFKEASVYVISNVSMVPTKDAAILKSNLKKQTTSVVNWHETILTMGLMGISVLYEMSSGDMLKKINKDITLKIKFKNV